MKKLLLNLLFAVMMVPWVTQGQSISEYIFSDSTSTYTSIASTGANIGLVGDDVSRQVSLPFSFPFGMGLYNSIYITSNGQIGVGVDPVEFAGGYYSTDVYTGNCNIISPMGHDLDIAQGSTIYVDSLNTSVVTVEWDSIQPLSVTNGFYCFQVKLYPSGDIEFHYGAMSIPTQQTDVVVRIREFAINSSLSVTSSWSTPVISTASTLSYLTLSSTEHPASGTMYHFERPYVACPAPFNFAASNITSTTADLSWTSLVAASSYTLEYGISGFSLGTGTQEIANDTTIQLTELSSNTLYDVYIYSDCGSGELSDTIMISFRTGCGDLVLPYIETFDSYGSGSTAYPSCWTKITTSSSYPYCYNSYNSTAPASLYFYSSTSNYCAAIMPRINTDITPMSSLELSFSYFSTANYYQIVVGVLTDSSDITSIVPLDTIIPAVAYTRYHHTVSFANYTGTGNHIVLLSDRNNTNYMYIDDIMLQVVDTTCPSPYNALITDVTSNSIDLIWSDSTATASYIVKWSTANDLRTAVDSVLVADTVLSLEELQPGTNYYIWVSTDCSGSQSAWVPFGNCATACLPFPHDSLPLVQNFNNWATGSTLTTAIDPCWRRFTNYSSAVPYTNASGRTGNAMYFYKGGTSYYGYMVLPLFEDSINTLQMKFWMMKSNTSYSNNILVGVMTNPYDMNTFRTVADVSPENVSTWEEMYVSFANYQGQGKYIALLAPTAASYSYSYIDDIEVSNIPPCAQPMRLNVSNVRANSAFVSWQPMRGLEGYPLGYEVEITQPGQAPVVEEVDAPYYMMSNLTLATTYSVRVRALCENSTVSGWTESVSFTTNLCVAIDDSEQDTILLGDAAATGTSYYIPLNNFYNYTYTQQLFTPAEVGGAQVFASLAFDYAYSSTMTAKTNVSIYLGHSPDSTFASTNSMIPFDSLTLVYTGPLNCRTGWNTFNFDVPFAYNGVDNLVVAVDDNSGSYNSSSYTFRTHSSPSGNRTLYYYSDSYNPSPENPSSFSGTKTAYASRNNILFLTGTCDNQPNCVAPNVVAVDSQTTEITVTWAPGFDEGSWNVEYKSEYDTAWIFAATVQNDYSYTITSLNPGTFYEVKVSSVCTDGEEYSIASMRTACAAIDSLPWIETFNNSGTGTTVKSPACWTAYSNYSTSYPYISTRNYVDSTLPAGTTPGSMYMYIYDASGTGTNYTYTALPEIDTNLYRMDSLRVEFQMYKATSSYPEFSVIVGVMNDPADISTFVPVDTVYIRQTSRWHDAEVFLRGYTGNGSHIAFMSKILPTTGSSYNQPSIDNILVDVIGECSRPSNITLDNITDASADVSWTDYSSMSWIVEYGPYGYTHGDSTSTTIAVTDRFAVLTGLNQNALYDVYVRGVCNTGDTTRWSPLTVFRTECSAINAVPWSENFSGYGTGSGVTHPCFPSASTYSTSYPYITSTNAPGSAGGSMYMYCYDYNRAGYYTYFAITPIDTTALSFDTLQTTFKVYQSSDYNSPVIVGVMTDPTNMSTFVPVDTVYATTTGSWQTFEVLLSSYTGNGTHLAFVTKIVGSSTTVCPYIDDVVLEVMPSCPRPQDVVSVGSQSNAITVDWREMGGATEWQLCYGPAPINPSLGQGTIISGVTTRPYTITGLSNDTLYNVYVRSICAPGDTSNWSYTYASVTPGSYNMPTTGVDTIYMCDGWIYDNGGPSANYSNNLNGTLIIYPSSPLNVVSISGSYTGESCCDYLRIYDGVGTNATELYNDCGSISDLEFTSTTGPLTIQFTSDGSGVYAGFAFNVQCISNTCPRVQDLAATYVTNSMIVLDWNETGPATEWEVAYGPQGFNIDSINQGTRIVVNAHPCTLNYLTPMTRYDVYVRGLCGVGDTAGWKQITVATGYCETPVINEISAASLGQTYYYPFCSFYNYSYTQQIYYPGEIDTLETGEPMDISALAFQYFYNTPEQRANVEIYLGHIQDSVFATTTSWVRDTLLTKVFEGDIEWNNEGNNSWFEIQLDTVFTYNNTDNLVVVMLDGNGDYSNSNNKLYTHTTGVNNAMEYHTDGSPINMASPPTGTRHTYRSNIRFISCDPCSMPSTATIEPAATSAVVTFANVGNYEISYKATLAADWSDNISVVNSNTYTVTGLQPETEYDFRMRTVCDSTTMSGWYMLPIMTLELPCVAPVDFSVSNIAYSSATVAWVDSSNNQEAWKVAYGFGNDASAWDTVDVTTPSIDLDGLYYNTEYTVYVKAYCSVEADVYAEWSPAFTFRTASCEGVTNIVANDITAEGATISWTAPAGQTKWEISYGLEGVVENNGTKIIVENTPVYAITGLESEFLYDVYVRSICEDGVYSAWSTKIQFRTTRTGINTASTDNVKVQIYPNPANSEATVTVDGITGEAEFVLADMNGRIIVTETVNCEGSLVKTINVSNLAKGAYFVHIYNNDFNTTRKLIVK